MKEQSEIRQKAHELVKKVKDQNFMWLYLITIFVWVILFLIKLFLWGMDIQGLVSSVLDNMLGLLPPMFIFDFVYEKLTRDASSMETSEKIAETLMGDPETLALFSEEQRRIFINSAISSIVKDGMADGMVAQCLNAYLTSKPHYKIRPQFRYDIRLFKNIPQNEVFDDKDYFYVEEMLSYHVKYLDREIKEYFPSEFWVGFFAKSDKLDSALRENTEADNRNYLFRESLNIKNSDLERLKKLPADKQQEIFKNIFKLKVRTDDKYAKIEEIRIENGAENGGGENRTENYGIFVKMKSEHDIEKEIHSVLIYFHMPQKWNSEVVVAISDPTYSPEIMVSYEEGNMDVEMYSFFSESRESAVENAVDADNGIYNIAVVDRWIYPMSGMVFTVKEEEAPEAL